MMRGSVTSDSPHELTLLLHDWYRGDQAALDRIIPRVYSELRRLAHIYMVREQPGHILQTTALINEAFLRLTQADKVEWQNRTHFFAISASLMRRVLVDFARIRGSRKEERIRRRFHSMNRLWFRLRMILT